MVVNHVECSNDEEVKEFKRNWTNGVYKEELKESLEFIKQNEVWS